MSALLRKIRLGKGKKKEALKSALERVAQEKRRKEDEEYAALEAEAYQELPTLSEEPELPSELEYLTEELGRIKPEARQYFIDKVVAEHYGVKRKTKDSEGMISYGKVEGQILELEGRLDSFAQCIGLYRGPKPYKRSGRKNLKELAKMGFLDEEKTLVYLAAVYRLGEAFNREDLENKKEKEKIRFLKWSLIGMVGYNALLGGISVLTGQPLVMLASTASVLGFPLFGVESSNFEGNEIKYKKALTKHIQKKGQDLDLHLNIAIDYAGRLQKQLANPEKLSQEYSNKLYEIPERISQAKAYLSKATKLFQEIKDKLEL